MFELPEAKRVRREDLNASDDSAWSEQDGEGSNDDAELRAKLNAQIAKSLGLDDSVMTDVQDAETSERQMPSEAQEADDDDDGDEEFAFRLFSTAQPTQKVVLEEDVEPQGEGVFINPTRPLSYYIITDLSERQRHEYDYAAVSGDDVLARSNTRYWGLEMPWRVTRITVTRKGKTFEEAHDPTRRRRPGKKQRISLRKRAKAKEERDKAAAEKLAEKEEHIKDKKKRMNRLKKLRKRAKNKEAKAAAREDGDGSGNESAADE